MIYKNVLVPFDKSVHATHALQRALELISDDSDATLTVLYVTEANNSEDVTLAAAARMAGVQAVDNGAANSLDQAFRDRKTEELEKEVASIVKDAPNRILYKVATGRPHHAILNYAYDHSCDLIVMGCRGLNALQGMMGSVSYAVVRAAAVPVFVVK